MSAVMQPRASALVLAFLLLPGLALLADTADGAAIRTDVAKLAAPIVGASAAYAEGKTYVFGGRLSDGEYSPNILSVSGAEVKVVRQLPNSLDPTVQGAGRYSATAVAFGSKIYYFGGTQLVEADINADGTPEKVPKASRDIIEFDATTGNARILTDKLPLGAWGMSGVAANGKIYLFGGFTFDITDLGSTKRHDRILRFDPGIGEGSPGRVAETITKLPYAVQDSAAAFIGRRVYVMAGLSDHNVETNPCPTYSFYNSASQQQETRQIEVCLTKRIVSFDPFNELVVGVAGELPYRAQFASAVVVNQKAYVPGAYLADGTASSSIIQVSVDAQSNLVAKAITPTLPRGTFGQAVATDGSVITIAGGRTGGDRDLTDEVIVLDPRPTPPWAPRSATANEIPGGVRLTWEAPSYDGDAVVTGYRIYRTDSSAVETRVAEVTTLAYDDTTIRPGQEYIWRIVAVNSAGEGVQSARISRASGIAVPGAVSSFQAFAGNGEVILRWRAPDETGGSNVTGYRIMRNDQLLTSLGPDKLEYVDKAVTNGQTYLYHVRAYNARGDGNLGQALRVTPEAVPPAPPTLVTELVGDASKSSVRLTWAAPNEPVDRFVVLRSTTPGGVGVEIQNTTQTSFLDTAVERGQTYYYTVASLNAVGRSPPSTEAAVSLVRKPGAPTDVTAVGLDGEIRLSWTAPADTGDAPAETLRYFVSRTGGGASRSIVLRDGIDQTTFVDRAVTPGLAYSYTVTTTNPMESDASASASATAKAILNKPPEARLAILPPIASAGDPVELDASQSFDIDGTIRTYLFDFGDGTDPVTVERPTITHVYTQNGTYSATVIATDDRGNVSRSASAQILVGETVDPNANRESGLPGRGSGNRDTTQQPGSETPAIPGPGIGLVLLGAALVALVARRR